MAALLLFAFLITIVLGGLWHGANWTFVVWGTPLVVLEPLLVRATARPGIEAWWRVPALMRGTAYAGLTLAIIAFGGATQKFIYFDF